MISEADSSLEAQADEATLNVLSARLDALLTQLNEVDAAVEQLVPDEEAEENYARTNAYNDRIVTCVARLSQQAGAQRANAITAAEASWAPRNGNLRANGSKGTVPYSNTSATVAVFRAVVAENKCALTTQLKSFWELESIGIVDQVPHNQEHEEVHKAFESSIKFTNGRYEVALPWKPMDFRLADNEGVAKKRLASLTQKLLKDEAMLTKYDEAIRQHFEQGFAERLPKNAKYGYGGAGNVTMWLLR
ncbi:hypothetical protein MTO96_004209 [Rhipicephalus appendiculatus]